MVRQDILAGLKNAVERGESTEQAKESFIKAGYEREEVEEAEKTLSSTGNLKEISPKTEEKEKPKKKMPYSLIIIAAVLILLAVFLYFDFQGIIKTGLLQQFFK